jgi:2-(1,2-epoxy-1,2-dihydrophenyl)acetyl-CoA isomerase
MAYEKLKIDQDGKVVILTLNDPASLNAASNEVVADFVDAIGRIASGDIACRAIVITGEGRGFCSGANLAGRRPGGGTGDAGERLEAVFNPLMRKMRDLAVPIVTAVNGPAAGVGCSLALMGDIVVCGESGYFLQAFGRIGLVPDGGSTWMLPRMIGKARAMEMMLLAEKIPAAQALDWGLVNRVVPDAELMPTAITLAKKLADGPASIGMIRKLVWQSLDLDHAAALDAERWTQKDAGSTADFAEGVKAFLEKRPAQFTGA